MANALFPLYKAQLLDNGVDLITGNVKVLLIDLADYTYSAAHEFHDDVAAGSIVATSGNLASKTATSGVFDAADITWSSVTGDPSEAIIVYRDSGTSGTSELVAYIDTGVTGLPVTPNSGDIIVTWDSGGDKIFAL